MDCSAPEITAVSNPKRKPPNAITSDHRKTFFLFIWQLVSTPKYHSMTPKAF
jgi:hypothetical protein